VTAIAQSDEERPLETAALLESLLFVASGPVTAERLATALETSPAVVHSLLKTLEEGYCQRGLRLQWSSDHQVQLTTAPEASSVIERFLGLEVTSRLSQAATEVLAIVAYMQPVTRPQVDQIRGVNSDGALRSLLSKGLIEEIGRLESPGRPILYGTTPEFLQHFGLAKLDEMPPLLEEAVVPEQWPRMESRTDEQAKEGR
jgi:segregation and condensation protein B